MSHQLLDEAAAKPEIEGINPGRFNVLGDGNYLIYVKTLAADRRIISQLFAHALHEDEEYLVTSSGAREIRDTKSGERYLVLENGFRYEGKPGQSEFNVVQFKEHGLLLNERAIVPSKRRRNAISTSTLWKSSVPADQAELQWRIAVPISTLLLALLAVPLSRTAPREGRFGRLIVGILLYIVYNNLLSVARAALGKGEVSVWDRYLVGASDIAGSVVRFPLEPTPFAWAAPQQGGEPCACLIVISAARWWSTR